MRKSLWQIVEALDCSEGRCLCCMAGLRHSRNTTNIGNGSNFSHCNNHLLSLPLKHFREQWQQVDVYGCAHREEIEMSTGGGPEESSDAGL